MPVLHVVISGQVQGVGFRYFVRQRARALELAGWVRNLPDGRVEVAAAGDDGAVATLRRLLAAGPQGARVARVDDRDEPFGVPPELHQPFEILR